MEGSDGAAADAAPVVPPLEKTFLEKYWMYTLPAVVLVSSFLICQSLSASPTAGLGHDQSSIKSQGFGSRVGSGVEALAIRCMRGEVICAVSGTFPNDLDPRHMSTGETSYTL